MVTSQSGNLYCSDGQRYYLPKKEIFTVTAKPLILPKKVIAYPDWEYKQSLDLTIEDDWFSNKHSDITLYILWLTFVCLFSTAIYMGFKILNRRIKKAKGIPIMSA